MKVSCLVPVHNKAFFVAHTVKSVFNQTYPCEIILSDQGSTDDSLNILHKLAEGYIGHHTVRVVQCPHTQVKGLSGFNVHLNWLHDQTDADLLVIVSADDLCHPDRVKKTVEIYEKYKPSLIGTRMQFLKPDMTYEGTTVFAYDIEPTGIESEGRLVTAREHIERLVGGSSSMAWDREFYLKVGGLHGHTIVDVYLPFLATLDRGFFFINQDLFAYIQHPKSDNAGLGGQMRAAETEDEKLLINELSNYQVVSTLYKAGRVAVHLFPEKWEGDACESLYQNIVTRTNDWTTCRDLLNERGLQPRNL